MTSDNETDTNDSNKTSMQPSPISYSSSADQPHRLEHELKDTMEIGDRLSLKEQLELKTVVGLALVDDTCNSLINEWIIDSGASMHLCNNKEWFTEFTDLPIKSVNIANTKVHLDITGGGTVLLNVYTKQGLWNQVTLSNVLYAPDAMCNLLSVSQITSKGAKGYIDDTTFNIIHNDELLMDSTVHNGLFHLNMHHESTFNIINTTSTDVALANTLPTNIDNDRPTEDVNPVDEDGNDEANDQPTEDTESVDDPDTTPTPGFNFNDRVWALHRDLGHMSLDSMSRLVDMSEGMTVSKKEIKARMGQSCPVCKVTTSVVRIPRDPASRTSTAPGDLLHIDV